MEDRVECHRWKFHSALAPGGRSVLAVSSERVALNPVKRPPSHYKKVYLNHPGTRYRSHSKITDAQRAIIHPREVPNRWDLPSRQISRLFCPNSIGKKSTVEPVTFFVKILVNRNTLFRIFEHSVTKRIDSYGTAPYRLLTVFPPTRNTVRTVPKYRNAPSICHSLCPFPLHDTVRTVPKCRNAPSICHSLCPKVAA